MLNLKPESISTEENAGLPEGVHKCVVAAAIDKPDLVSKKGDRYSKVSLRLECIEGEHEGKSIWSDLIYFHESSEKAMEIGTRQIKYLYLAGECTGDINTESLQDAKPVMVTVKMRKGNEQYPDRPEVYKFAKAETTPAGGTW